MASAHLTIRRTAPALAAILAFVCLTACAGKQDASADGGSGAEQPSGQPGGQSGGQPGLLPFRNLPVPLPRGDGGIYRENLPPVEGHRHPTTMPAATVTQRYERAELELPAIGRVDTGPVVGKLLFDAILLTEASAALVAALDVQAINSLATNAAKLTTTLATTDLPALVAKLPPILEQLTATLGQLPGTLTRVDTTLDQLNALLAKLPPEDVARLIQTANAVLSGTQPIVAQLPVTLEQTNKLLTALNGQLPPVLTNTADLLTQTSTVLAETRTVLNQTQPLLAQLPEVTSKLDKTLAADADRLIPAVLSTLQLTQYLVFATFGAMAFVGVVLIILVAVLLKKARSEG